MAKAVLAVYTHPSSPELDAEFNRWYDEEHLADVAKVPGIVGARRYRLSKAQREGSVIPDDTPPYLALYDIDAEDLQGCLDELKSRGGTDLMPISPAMGRSGDVAPTVVLYETL